ncbi:hypothetical protein ACFO0N_07345 [Halobium salinum]|uniref:AbrB/MazE/SpoVT family DNA-binding domain-containing protein n=1 Tax=Halobium salinum TaxID=1364940 RepID=A0ABD5PAP8_9EURY|nr:hypothetical protein [Halobium salinum]
MVKVAESTITGANNTFIPPSVRSALEVESSDQVEWHVKAVDGEQQVVLMGAER